jgi:hypothetical protein
MAGNPLARIGQAALVLVLAVGCNRRNAATGVAPPGESKPAPPGVVQGGLLGKKYYPSMKKEQVDRVMSSEIQKESEVVAILGEPTERSETRRWFNAKYGMNMEQYELTWYKAEGVPAVRVTFLNNMKTTVLSGVGE